MYIICKYTIPQCVVQSSSTRALCIILATGKFVTMCNILLRLLYGVLILHNTNFCPISCVPMSSVHVKCIMNYTCEVSLECECTRKLQL